MRTEYTHEDGEEILKRAIAIDSRETSAREMVRRTAAEMGVSEDALARAEQAYFAEKREREQLAEFKRHRNRSFFSNLASFVAVNAVLIFIDFLGDRSLGWSMYPLFAWGIWMVFHVVETFFDRGEDFEKRFRSWQKKRTPQDEAL